MNICLYCNKRSNIKSSEFEVKQDTELLEEVDSMKYLGIYLDKHLTFNVHIQYIIKKVNQRTNMLWKMRNYMYIDEPLA